MIRYSIHKSLKSFSPLISKASPLVLSKTSKINATSNQSNQHSINSVLPNVNINLKCNRFYTNTPGGGNQNFNLGDMFNEHKNGGALEAYCTDLTKLARENKLDPMIGREEVLRQTIEVLSRRRKNNPILIGEPGVGKTCIIEGLAQRIALGEVPETVKGKRVLSLDFGALLAGAGVKGQFEQRLKSVIKEVEQAGDIILFVDEVHLLSSGSSVAGGDSADAANLLKPALARGTMLFCGATTLDEYRKHIEKDGALARRFETIYVDEPSIQETISILRGIKEKYELHHKVTISDSAVVAASNLAKRFFRDRRLPDKAIDLLDEAASRLCMQLESKPDSIDLLERSIMQRKIELTALKKETDEGVLHRRKVIEESIAKDEKKLELLTKIWNNERAKRVTYNSLKESLEKERFNLQNALKTGDYTKAGELQHVLIPKLEKDLNEMKRNMKNQRSAYAAKHKDDEPVSSNKVLSEDSINEEEVTDTFRSVLLAESVTDEDIANVVARHTGIPVNKLLHKDKQRLLQMEEILGKRVVGQDDAISSVSECVRVSRAGLQQPSRPHGVFMFLGPSGVGKTELCKALAEFLFDDPNAMTRLDMSEYHEKFASSRLIGAPPGYVGYEEGGTLTEAIRRRPYQIVLFDEIEKAHREVCNLLLQVFDEGSLTDSQGRKIDFRNTLIIMTSNLGAKEAQEFVFGNRNLNISHLKSENSQSLISDLTPSDLANMDEIMRTSVRHHFAPEFINRIDDIVTFAPLTRKSMAPIVKIQLHNLEALLDEKRIKMNYSNDAIQWLANMGFDPLLGARPLKRVINTFVLQPLSRAILSNQLVPKSAVYVYGPKELLPKEKQHVEHPTFDDLVIPEGEVLISDMTHSIVAGKVSIGKSIASLENLVFTVILPQSKKQIDGNSISHDERQE